MQSVRLTFAFPLRPLLIQHRYTYALHALSHALLLAPQNPFIFLQFAETAYTSGDIPLALKMYLVVIDMNDGEGADTIPQGLSIRAWWGVKLVSQPTLISIDRSWTFNSAPND